MPKKGRTITRISRDDIDLGWWLDDHEYKGNYSDADVARQLGVAPSRVHELRTGKANTITFLRIIIEKIYQGDASKMVDCCKSDQGLMILMDELLRGIVKGDDELKKAAFQIVKKTYRLAKTDPEKLKAWAKNDKED